MGWARNGTGPKWDTRNQNGTLGTEMGWARSGTGPKWPGPKWPARNGWARNGRARNGIDPKLGSSSATFLEQRSLSRLKDYEDTF